MPSTIAANIERFTGFADCYDSNRPRPPVALVEVLTQLAAVARPRRGVDLGSGTGLSTRLWAGRAESIVGIEPNADMRRQAEMHSKIPGISYREGFSDDTSLPDGCADIVTCSQSLHWMDPEPTFAEIARILRPGGVFAAVDCDWPPTLNGEVEAAYASFEAQVARLERERQCSPEVRKWSKHEHLSRMQASGRFRFTKEILLHQIEYGDAARFVGLALSQGSVEAILKHGLTEEQIGLTELRRICQRVVGNRQVRWFFSYRVRVGLK